MEKIFLRCFTASWCGPCKTLKPILTEVENETNVEVQYVDIEENVDLTQKEQIRSVPTLQFVKNDVVLESINGILPKAKLVEKLHQHDLAK